MNALLTPVRRSTQRIAPAWPARRSFEMKAPANNRGTSASRACNRELWERLVIEHRDRMLAVAKRILGCDDDAADAVQDAFLSAFTSLDRFQARSQLSTWLHRIVVNAALMKLRERKRRRLVAFDALEMVADTDSSECSLTGLACGDMANLEREEAQFLVRNAINNLSADHREIIILRDIQELDTDTTARLLGISRPATKTRLHRARRALRREIERDASGPSTLKCHPEGALATEGSRFHCHTHRMKCAASTKILRSPTTAAQRCPALSE